MLTMQQFELPFMMHATEEYLILHAIDSKFISSLVPRYKGLFDT